MPNTFAVISTSSFLIYLALGKETASKATISTRMSNGCTSLLKSKNYRRHRSLLGHSFGSIVSAAYAVKYPKTIKKLILVNPIGAPALEGPRKTFTKLTSVYYKVGTKLPEKAAKKWLSSKAVVRVMSIAMAKTHDKKLRALIHDQHRQHFSKFHSAQSVSEGFKTSISHNVGDFAKRVPVPTLLIAGALDDITPLGDQFALVKKFPSASLKVIDDVGHLTHYETPRDVARLVQEFVA